MLKLNFEPFPEIHTHRLTLRKILLSDAETIFFLRSDERVMKYIERPRTKTVNDALVFIEHINNLERNNEAITWGITLNGISALIGTICFWNIVAADDHAEIGYALHPDFHRQKIMQEAMEAVLNFGFETMQLNSVEAQVNPNNQASIRLLKSNGFVQEGYFKERYWFEDRFYDTAVYSLLKSGRQS